VDFVIVNALLNLGTHLRSLIQNIVHSVDVVHGDLTGVGHLYFSFPMILMLDNDSLMC
jgi:hypothetical protein